MEVLNALDLKKKGKKAEINRMGTLIQPTQFIPMAEKTPEWMAWNADWLEFQGLKQIRRNARRLLKNYKLAKGIIDRTDYIVEENQENADLISALTKDDTSALELRFYPIIPNVINTLVSEFAKRSTQISFRAMDEFSYNEMLEEKRNQIEQLLMYEAEQKIKEKLIEAGVPEDDPQFQEAVAPENLKSLPEIEQFFKKSYRSIAEQWAEHQYRVDVERFHMEELEEMAFRDMLITDREFWHFKMYEDDYEVELWNPVICFYHKTPEVRYISQGNWVGKIEMITVADAIDKYGWIMTEEQQRSLEQIYPVRSAGYAVQGYQNDGSFYDATKSHDWNVNMPSLSMRQYMSVWDGVLQGGDIVNYIMSESEDFFDMGTNYLLRCTTAYWKSQRRIGHLTKIDDVGNVTKDIVDETYVVTDKPIYDTTLFKNKTKENLIFGEHIDWIWINYTCGVVKLGPNRPSFWGMPSYGGITPIYLGINKNIPGPVPFQFKGDESLYGCKLPVEGSVFSDRNTRSTSLVDLMKPYQIGYNIVNNQIADILIDELGTVIMLDQNSLPRHSLGEDWGKSNYAKAYVAMKNFQILPLDTTITNTENALNFNHFQKLDMEQTNRLMSRIQLANYFKAQAFETIGITPQRMGGQVEQTTATGVKMAIANSYAQTETYFIQHCDYLMPRVHQMRTDLAQYYQSKNPSVRLSYITTNEDRANFQINGTSLLLRDLNVFATTRADTRAIIEQLKQLALNSQSGTTSIYDLGNLVKATSISEIDTILKTSQENAEAQRREQMQHEQEMLNKQIEDKVNERREKMAFEADQNDKDRQANLLEAEIRAAGYGSVVDINENMQSDYLDAMESIRKRDEFQEVAEIDRTKMSNQAKFHEDKMLLGKQKLAMQKQIADNQLQIARENQTRSELIAKNKLKEKNQDSKKKKK